MLYRNKNGRNCYYIIYLVEHYVKTSRINFVKLHTRNFQYLSNQIVNLERKLRKGRHVHKCNIVDTETFKVCPLHATEGKLLRVHC